MKKYIMEWEYSERDISLKKIFYIVENFYDNDVNIYLMLHPQRKELLEKLKKARWSNILLG